MTKPLSEVCKELLDLHAKATEGPWVSQGTGMSPDHMADMNILRSHNRTPHISHEDANYIVAARDHLERICKALLKRTAELERMAKGAGDGGTEGYFAACALDALKEGGE